MMRVLPHDQQTAMVHVCCLQDIVNVIHHQEQASIHCPPGKEIVVSKKPENNLTSKSGWL